MKKVILLAMAMLFLFGCSSVLAMEELKGGESIVVNPNVRVVFYKDLTRKNGVIDVDIKSPVLNDWDSLSFADMLKETIVSDLLDRGVKINPESSIVFDIALAVGIDKVSTVIGHATIFSEDEPLFVLKSLGREDRTMGDGVTTLPRGLVLDLMKISVVRCVSGKLVEKVIFQLRERGLLVALAR